MKKFLLLSVIGLLLCNYAYAEDIKPSWCNVKRKVERNSFDGWLLKTKGYIQPMFCYVESYSGSSFVISEELEKSYCFSSERLRDQALHGIGE